MLLYVQALILKSGWVGLGMDGNGNLCLQVPLLRAPLGGAKKCHYWFNHHRNSSDPKLLYRQRRFLSRSPIACGMCLQGLFAHTLRIQRSRCGGMFMRQGCACRLPRLDIKRAASTSAQCRWPAERGNWQLLHANVSLGHAHPLTGASRST